MKNRLMLLRWPMLIVALCAALWYVPTGETPLDTRMFAQGYSSGNPYAYFVPPGACNSTVSANSTGTQGLTTSGASTMPVVAAQTSATGATNTHTYICNISPPYSVITTGNGIAITDAVFFYGVSVGGGIGSAQVATLASGTFNSSIVFSSVTYPAAATGESASTVTPVRADAGNLLITPTTANFNGTTTTAGAFLSVKFTPATAIAWKTDLKQLLLTVTIQTLAGTPTTTTTPGVLVHFQGQ